MWGSESNIEKSQRILDSIGRNRLQNNYKFNKLVKLYNKEIQTGIEQGKLNRTARAYKNLGNLYRQGIPDRYRKGKKIQGVDRNLDKAVEAYNNAYRYGSIDSLILLADMYQYDFIEEYYQKGAEKKARDLYHYIKEIGNRYQSIVADQRLSQMDMNLQNDISPFVNGSGLEGFQMIPINRSITVPTTNRGQVNPNTITNVENIQNLNENRGNIELIRNDPQNVHNSGITNSIRESINKLKLSTDILFNPQESLNQVTEFLNRNNKLSLEQKDDAFKVLDRIAKAEGVLSGTNETESSALSLVWNRIHNDINKDNRDNLKDNLANELVESVEHGKVVCSRGRFNRMFDTLNKIDPDVEIKPDWVFKHEMLAKANVIRNEMVSRLSKEEKRAVEDPDPDPVQEEICNHFNKKYKDTVLNKLKVEYVDSGLMSENAMNNQVHSWIDAIE